LFDLKLEQALLCLRINEKADLKKIAVLIGEFYGSRYCVVLACYDQLNVGGMFVERQRKFK